MKSSDAETKTELTEFQKIIGYRFKAVDILGTVFSHSSFVNENKFERKESNERLEFLGDSVVGVVTNRYLFEKYKDEDEGFLTRVKSMAVSQPSLAAAARKCNLGGYLLLGRGEEASEGRNKESNLSNAFEALVGAIYLDGGLESAAKFIKEFVLNNLVVDEREAKDYKSELQELIQKKFKKRPVYHIASEEGPEHQKTFIVRVAFAGSILGEGRGKSKKEAELSAAKEALKAF
ncbi:MAG: ribonuclease III [Candidatus Firestonebacteria bacterium RIFOXYA2_FULL_40_8]|nr:MAG: ribonuclease III [Candidatus Firestonebacteria bacterium RIFOXYA2_FULL_40_8]